MTTNEQGQETRLLGEKSAREELLQAELTRLKEENKALVKANEYLTEQLELANDTTLPSALLTPLREASAHLDELEGAWRRGVISEHDGKGGIRSNRNESVARQLRAALLTATQQAKGPVK